MKTFPSVLHSNYRGYRITDDWSEHWNSRGQTPLHLNLVQFETYGDGLTQHSNSYCTQFADFTDAGVSVSRAILLEPTAPEWSKLTDCVHCISDSTLRFALTIKYQEGKDQFYSIAERKLTRSDKRNDRRFERVQSWADGTPASAYRLVFRNHWEWFTRLLVCDKLRDLEFQRSDCFQSWSVLFAPTDQLAGAWQSALSCLSYALQATNLLSNIGHSIDIAIDNSNRPAPATPLEVPAELPDKLPVETPA